MPTEQSVPAPAVAESQISEVPAAEEQIRELAFKLYEQRGRQDGHDVEDWLEAEAIIRAQQRPAI
jgi:hypothetical protein